MLVFIIKVTVVGTLLYMSIMHPEFRPIQGKKWGIRRFRGKEENSDEQKET